MEEGLAIAVAVIVAAGVGAQLIASWLRIPSVLLLLPAGVIAGPVTGLVDPDELFGDALFPLVAIAVGLILFEGGLGLDVSGMRTVGRPVAALVTIGVAVTWAAGTGAAIVLLDLPLSLGLLIGAVLVVSGPTVVLPLLDSVRLREPIGPVLRWECIVIDPIGAVLAVAVFQAIIDAESNFNPLTVLLSSAAVGVAVGTAAGFALALVLRLHVVPDRLQSALTLAVVIGCFVAANALSVEAGLFATTVMGVVMANQPLAPVAHIAAFGEDLGVLLLGALFIVLGATIQFDAMRSVLLPSLGLLAVLLLVRPVAVWLSTIGSSLGNLDKAYLSLITPRGVVAASVAALFSVSLEAEGVEGAAKLAPAVFVVIIGSVSVASLIARPAAARLRVAAAERSGIVLAVDQHWPLELASALAEADVPVLLVPVDGQHEVAAERGILTYQGPLNGPQLVEAMEAVSAGSAVVAVGEKAAGTYLVERLSELLGRGNVFVVRVGEDAPGRLPSRAWGRRAFAGAMDALRPTGDGMQIMTVEADALDPRDPSTAPLFYLREPGKAAIAGPRGNERGARQVVVVRRESARSPHPPDANSQH